MMLAMTAAAIRTTTPEAISNFFFFDISALSDLLITS
jgi:hypothetical protein